MFHFNPPAPQCIGPAGRCPSVPKYWLMETDSFTDGGIPEIDIPPSFVSPFRAILGYKEIGFSFIGGGGVGFPFPIRQEIDFWGLLTSSGFPDTVQIGYEDHILFGPWYLYFDRFFSGEWRITLLLSGDRVEWSQIPLSDHPQPVKEREDRGFGYFDCLGPNRFYFFESPVIGDWPAEITITPFYP